MVFKGLDSVGRAILATRWRKNEGCENGGVKGMQKRGRKRVAALLKLLCRSLRGGRSADHLLSSTRKLSDANRFVSGRFKRFTIIRADSNSINASSSPRLPSPPYSTSPAPPIHLSFILHFVLADSIQKPVQSFFRLFYTWRMNHENIEVRASKSWWPWTLRTVQPNAKRRGIPLRDIAKNLNCTSFFFLHLAV